jgi:regulator of replication initiation timing
MAKTAQTLEIDAIERLEDKIKKLVAMVEHLRGDHARLTAENKASADELAALRKRLVDAEGATAEIAALRQERDQVRTRVSDMLTQLEALDL